MEEISPPRSRPESWPESWPESLLSGYRPMLSVSEVATVLNVEERTVRQLLTKARDGVRLPGVKIGKSWRIARDELSEYLRDHHTIDSSVPPEKAS